MAQTAQNLWIERVLGIGLNGQAHAPEPSVDRSRAATTAVDAHSDGDAAAYAQASDEWRNCRRGLQGKLTEVKEAVLDAYADEPDVAAELRGHLGAFDRIFDVLDDRLAATFDATGKAADPAARRKLAGEARTILSQYIQFVASDRLIEGLDENPFGIKVGFKATASKTLASLVGLTDTVP